jgi:hypothetical protein
MTLEPSRVATGLAAEQPAASDPTVATAADGVSPSMRLQILSTEHWSLLATRSLAWNETFSRAAMFLSTLSGAMVAIALVAQASSSSSGFVLFALAILPIVLFIGVATFVRLGASNYLDAVCVVGMNRIRAGYLEMAPELERFFVSSANDDQRGVAITMGVPPGMRSGLHVIAATPAVISTLDAVIAGVIAALVGVQLGGPTVVSLLAGLVAFGAAFVLQQRYARRYIARVRSSVRPMFPSPGEASMSAAKETR